MGLSLLLMIISSGIFQELFLLTRFPFSEKMAGMTNGVKEGNQHEKLSG